MCAATGRTLKTAFPGREAALDTQVTQNAATGIVLNARPVAVHMHFRIIPLSPVRD